MHTFSPVPATPAATQPFASAALERLARLSATLSVELLQLPKAQPALLDALSAGTPDQVEQETTHLLKQLTDYWLAPSAQGKPRRSLFAASVQAALEDEALLKSHEHELGLNAVECLPYSDSTANQSPQGQPVVSSLHVWFNEQTLVEIKGALVMSIPSGRTVLALPGSGLSEFRSEHELIETLVNWLNDEQLRWALLINADQRHQDALLAVTDDPQLFIDTFAAADLELQIVTGNPHRFVLTRQVDKQREDLRYVCGDGLNADPARHATQIESVIRMAGLFGPAAMLGRREQARIESRLRTDLPDWIKLALPQDRLAYIRHLERYDRAREALSSVLQGADSADRCAEVMLSARLANDLGYDLQPGKITVSTRRSLPVTGESYTVSRTLPELALYGLHPDDQQDGSAFQTATTVHIDDIPLGAAHASLTLPYIARLIDELNLRQGFAEYQRTTYAKAASQTQMRELIQAQVAESAYAAQMQGHISLEDFALIDAATKSATARNEGPLRAQCIWIKDVGMLGRILMFRQDNPRGALERLIMFTADAPRAQLFQSFRSENQLLEELVGWTVIPEMSDYLLQQVQASSRPAFSETLEALKLKPQPEPRLVQLISLDSYDASLQTFANQLTKVTLSNHASHAPDWYMKASASQRRRLLQLEDASNGAIGNYAAKAHTRIQDFEDYVHERASEKIAQLLKVAPGTVDPDQIFIKSERETLTYTQMLRNGYDDSLGLITPAADTVATFSGPAGVDLSALTPTSVARSVHGKWLADDYAALVKRNLLDTDSIGYVYRRKTSTLIALLQMQAAALRSLIQGHIDATQYQWLEIAIGNVHRSDTNARLRHPVYPLQIHIDKPFIASNLSLFDQLVIPDTNLTQIETVQGCFILSSAETRQAALLYTPQAPDGVEFRVFSSFAESLRQPGMIDYYKDRCRIKAGRVLSFFLNDMKDGKANKPLGFAKDSITDFAQFCFNRPLERKLRDVEDTSTGRHDMLSHLVWTSVEIIATALTLPFPPASLVLGVTLSLRDNVKAIQALASESPDDVYAFMLASILNMAGAAGDYSQGLKGFGGVLRKLAKDPKMATRPAALSKVVNPARQQHLYPVSLQDQPFLIGKPNAAGKAPVYRSLGFDNDEVYATRHYAVQDSKGAWQPLGQPSTTPTAPVSGGVSADRVVKVSLKDLPRMSEGHAAGVSLGDGKYYVELNGQAYQVQYDASMHCWHIVDPQNPFAFFGRQPVRLDDQGQWKLAQRSALRGGGKDDALGFMPLREEATASTAMPISLREFEVPKNYERHLDRILNTTPVEDIGAGVEEYFEVYYAQMRQTYFAVKEKLYRHAQAFFAGPLALPPRPLIPAVEASTSVGEFMSSVFTHSKGLILSEAPKSVASKRFLMAHMQTLVEQRVEVIYLPHLFTDKHLSKLAKYRAKGSNVRSGSHEIKNHLKLINGGALDNLSREHDYYHLIKEAHRHNIEIRPLSSSVSYPVNGFEVASAATDSTAAQKMSNFFGHTVIGADVAQDPSRRWVALLEQKMATTHDQVPGIAQLEGAISAHIEDVPVGQATRISADSASVATQSAGTPCDFKIEFPNADSPAPVLTPAITRHADDALPTTSGTQAIPGTARATDFGFHWDDATGWKRVSPKLWTAEKPPTALQQSLSDPAYEVPAESRRALHTLAYDTAKGLDSRYFTPGEDLLPTQGQFFQLRAKLQTESRPMIFAEFAPRPAMPPVEPSSSAMQFIENLYQQTDGMVIGEFHASIGSKQFIIDNLPLLAEQNVKTLYLEHLLTDLHQQDLDRFFETGHMSKGLLNDIRNLDRGHNTDPAKVYNFETLIIKAREHGVEVRAIDCAASYHLKGIRLETPTTRQQMMNFFASRTIRRHQAVMGKHRWVALVGNTHANTYKTVPGIAELEGAIGVRLDDVAPGTSRGITVDTGELRHAPMSKEEGFIKGDYKIEMEVPGAVDDLDPSPTLSLEQRLTRPGKFVIERELDDSQVIIYRSRNNEIQRTVVQFNAEGKVFVDRPSWAPIHLHPYENLEALVLALEKKNFSRVG
jgi:hypothetical protein